MFRSLAAMNRYGQPEEHQPVTWVGGYPLYAAHFIVAVFVVSLLATTLLVALHVGGPLHWLTYDNRLVLHGEVWRTFTYGLVNAPSLRFAFDMVYLAWFGREVERIFGRKKFLFLFAAIYLLPPLLFTPLGPWLDVERVGETGALAVFVAFATYYPEVAIFFHLTAKWCAWILVGIFSLMALASNDWAELAWLWLACGFAHQWVRHEKGLFTLPNLRFWRRRPKLRVLPDLPEKRRSESAPEEASMSDIDALLDKIARSGIGSLTAKERARLEKGRENLLKKESGRR